VMIEKYETLVVAVFLEKLKLERKTKTFFF
jgi:hypothetical protein